jgi:hypothetical protein
MIRQLGLNVSDVASFYTQNITIVRKVYDTVFKRTHPYPVALLPIGLSYF